MISLQALKGLMVQVGQLRPEQQSMVVSQVDSAGGLPSLPSM